MKKLLTSIFISLSFLLVTVNVYAQPANDDCAGATSINQNTTCINTAGTTVGATLSMAATPCNGNPDDDVWYSFVATATDAAITISGAAAVTGTSTDMYFQVLSGACGSQTSLLCSDPDAGIVGGLTVGQTYYIRVYTYFNTSRVTFNLCVSQLTTAPASCPTLSAPPTGSQVSPNPTLTWSSVTNATAYDIYLGTTNPPVTLYATSNTTSYTVTPPLTVGTTYYWYVVAKNSVGAFTACTGNTRSFTVVAPPANDDCGGATPLTVNTDQTCTAVTAGTTVAATQSLAGCVGTADDDVWFSFVATAPIHKIKITNVVAASGSSVDIVHQIFSGTCAGLTSLYCTDTPDSTVATSLIIGNTYYVRVYNYGNINRNTFNICVTTMPTPPVNDDCAGAIALTVNTDQTCSAITSGTTVAATQSQAGCAGTADDDVWFSFVATAPVHKIKITNVVAASGSSVDIVHQIFSGTCALLTSLYCTDTPDSTVAASLIVGNTYYVRVYNYGTALNRNTFNICVTTMPTPPANDECAGAISVTTQAYSTSCVSSTAANSTNATPSFIAETSCITSNDNDDIFYSFTATSTTQILRFSNMVATLGTATTLGYQIYSACTAASQLTSCSTGFGSGGTGSVAITGLTVGTTYNLRLFTGGTGNSATFDFCLQDPAPPPANDYCAVAIPITTQPFSVPCSGTVSANTSGAAASLLTETTCVSGNDDDDIFYSFTATATSQILRFSNMVATVGSSTTLGYHVFASCASGTSLASCSATFGSAGAGSTAITGLTVGTTYYLQLFTGTTGANASFDFCLQDPATPPANDNCAGAIAITTQPFSVPCSGTVSANTSGAAASLLTETTCATGNDDDDIFYSFTATATSQILRFSNMVATLGTTTTIGYHVFASCASGTSLASCSTGFGTAGAGNTTITGLTIGTTYYLQLFTGTTGATATFDFCLQNPAPPVANDECATAIPVTTQAYNTTCTSSTAANTNGATASAITETSCSTGNDDDDIFYSFTATATSQVLNFSNMVAGTGTPTQLGYHIFTACTAASQLTSCSSAFGTAGAGTTTITGLTVGTSYNLRLFTGGTANSATFDFCIQDPPPPPVNDNCAGAISLNGGVIINGTTIGATQTLAPEICAGFTAGAALDVFYTFTTTAAGTATIALTTTDGTFDGVIQVYSGTCGTLGAPIGCADATTSGGAETVVLTGLAAGVTYYLRVYDYSGTGTFTITAGGAALPITVEYFKGSRQAAGNVIEWKVNCTGSPSANMTIERSADAIQFEGIYNTIETAQRCLQPFSYTDKTPLSGMNYYRLKTTDADGRVTYSAIVALLNKNKGFEFVNLVPNPVRAEVLLNIVSATASSMDITVSDVTGRQLQAKKVTLVAGNNNVKMNFTNLSAGVYYITGYTSDGEKKTVKFIKE